VAEEKSVKAIITPKAQLSYPHIDKPQEAQNPGEKPKYSVTLVFAPDANLDEMVEMAKLAGVEKFGSKGANLVRVGGKGSTFRNDVEGKYPEGSIYISARSETKPGAVFLWAGPDNKPAVIPDDQIREQLYPGAFVRAQLKPFGYDKKGNKGIGWALNNIQKLGDGERLDSRQAATEAFDADMNAVPADLKGLV
jgi:hypothetical protein